MNYAKGILAFAALIAAVILFGYFMYETKKLSEYKPYVPTAEQVAKRKSDSIIGVKLEMQVDSMQALALKVAYSRGYRRGLEIGAKGERNHWMPNEIEMYFNTDSTMVANLMDNIYLKDKKNVKAKKASPVRNK